MRRAAIRKQSAPALFTGKVGAQHPPYRASLACGYVTAAQGSGRGTK